MPYSSIARMSCTVIPAEARAVFSGMSTLRMPIMQTWAGSTRVGSGGNTSSKPGMPVR